MSTNDEQEATQAFVKYIKILEAERNVHRRRAEKEARTAQRLAILTVVRSIRPMLSEAFQRLHRICLHVPYAIKEQTACSCNTLSRLGRHQLRRHIERWHRQANGLQVSRLLACLQSLCKASIATNLMGHAYLSAGLTALRMMPLPEKRPFQNPESYDKDQPQTLSQIAAQVPQHHIEPVSQTDSNFNEEQLQSNGQVANEVLPKASPEGVQSVQQPAADQQAPLKQQVTTLVESLSCAWEDKHNVKPHSHVLALSSLEPLITNKSPTAQAAIKAAVPDLIKVLLCMMASPHSGLSSKAATLLAKIVEGRAALAPAVRSMMTPMIETLFTMALSPSAVQQRFGDEILHVIILGHADANVSSGLTPSHSISDTNYGYITQDAVTTLVKCAMAVSDCSTATFSRTGFKLPLRRLRIVKVMAARLVEAAVLKLPPPGLDPCADHTLSKIVTMMAQSGAEEQASGIATSHPDSAYAVWQRLLRQLVFDVNCAPLVKANKAKDLIITLSGSESVWNALAASDENVHPESQTALQQKCRRSQDLKSFNGNDSFLANERMCKTPDRPPKGILKKKAAQY